MKANHRRLPVRKPRYPDQCSREFQEANDARRREITKARNKMDTLNKKVQEMSQNVAGLCEKKCSCDICRTARKNCKEYMDLVHESIAAWGEYERLKTIDDCATRDAGMPIRNSHTKLNERLLAIIKG